ncbi:MAG: hypothetical protein RL240_1020 [Planctomycetota bacterium]|jgi:hypothetical protein
MPASPNPFEPPPSIPLDPTTAIPLGSHQAEREQILRVRYVVSMWVFGVLGKIGLPSFSIMLTDPPTYIFSWFGIYVGRAELGQIDWTVHLHLLVDLVLGLASVISSICLFRLPRLFDKLGALTTIALVGMLPVWSSIRLWWELFTITPHPLL